MKRILVGTDFSPLSRLAVEAAASWARRHGAALRLVHVLPPRRRLIGLWGMSLPIVSSVEQRADAALKELAEALSPARDIDVSTELVSGAASVQIARTAVRFGADLLVTGTHGEHNLVRGRVTLGGTSTKLVSITPIPLLLVRTAAAATPNSVLACVDLSPVSNLVLSWARASVTSGGKLSAFHAYETPLAARLDVYGISKDSIDEHSQADERNHRDQVNALVGSVVNDHDVQTIVVHGDAIDQLSECVAQTRPDVIVLGKHTRRAGRRRASWAGSVSRHMALFAPTNVLLVPSRE